MSFSKHDSTVHSHGGATYFAGVGVDLSYRAVEMDHSFLLSHMLTAEWSRACFGLNRHYDSDGMLLLPALGYAQPSCFPFYAIASHY